MSKTPREIMTIVGARPQFIKAAPVSRALKAVGLKESMIHTGQHSDANMSGVFFEELEIPKPDFFLGISGLSHGAMTGEMLKRIEEILLVRKPDAVLVYGDTNSTLAGALAASKLHIPIAHVEAGLRSFNMRMPEEINRTLTDRVSQWLFCPTATAVTNLSAEGYAGSSQIIENVGDVMYDAAVYFKAKARWPKSISTDLNKGPFLLCTLHRQESIDDPEIFGELLSALVSLARGGMPIVWPAHPRAHKALVARGFVAPVGLHVIEPVSYIEMLALLDACSIVATDSGGLQKEAYFAKKHCLTLRTETEWVELVEIGANTICGVSSEIIVREANAKHPPVGNAKPYGNGDASEKIARTLGSVLSV